MREFRQGCNAFDIPAPIQDVVELSKSERTLTPRAASGAVET
jgi:hypothetical protein